VAEPTAWLGVGIDRGEVGVLVTDVVDEAPAHTAGLLPGDEIVAIDGSRVAEPVDLQRRIRAKRAGQKVELRVLRDDRDFRVRVALEPMPDRNEILRRRLVDKPAPAFDLEVIGGNQKGALRDLRGKVVLVEFWSTFCAACEASHTALSELASSRARDGLAVLVISRESEAVLKHYLGKHRPEFTVARDADGEASKAFYAQEIPTLVVIDRRGIVRFAGVREDPARSRLSAREATEANVAAAIFAAERLLGTRRRTVGKGAARPTR
jgi:peroxiredoxin